MDFERKEVFIDTIEWQDTYSFWKMKTHCIAP